MRLIFQCCIIVLAIAIFPLSSTQHVTPWKYFSKMSIDPCERVSRSAGADFDNKLLAELQAPCLLPPEEVLQAARKAPLKFEITIPVTVAKADALRRPEKFQKTPPKLKQAKYDTLFEENALLASGDVNDSILVIGDSLSIPLGQQLEAYFKKKKNVGFMRRGKVSSGLARPDFFDWEKNLTELARSMKPSTVVIMIGTNDNQTLRGKGPKVRFGTKQWEKEYVARAERLFDICRTNNPDVRIFWVGAPIMGRPNLLADVRKINGVIADLCLRNQDCTYIDTWDALADDRGRFTKFMADSSGEKVRVRADDGVHLTRFGSKIIAGRTLKKMTTAIRKSEPTG